jgi:hypothetical protein
MMVVTQAIGQVNTPSSRRERQGITAPIETERKRTKAAAPNCPRQTKDFESQCKTLAMPKSDGNSIEAAGQTRRNLQDHG